jgi:anti-sigma B factor antagonist
VTTPLELSVRQDGDGTAVISAVGEVDMSNVAEFRTALAQAGAGDGRFVVVDLSGVDYLDSAGLTVLLPHAPRIKIIATPVLAPVLTISGLAEVTSVVPGP